MTWLRYLIERMMMHSRIRSHRKDIEEIDRMILKMDEERPLLLYHKKHLEDEIVLLKRELQSNGH